ncbi:MAG: Ldh family oxidoreductase, partial [Janthinobacterium lividum]
MLAMTFSYQQLFTFAEQVFLAIGCPPDDATLATETLLSADLRGVDSHGVARLSGYVRL